MLTGDTKIRYTSLIYSHHEHGTYGNTIKVMLNKQINTLLFLWAHTNLLS